MTIADPHNVRSCWTGAGSFRPFGLPDEEDKLTDFAATNASPSSFVRDDGDPVIPRDSAFILNGSFNRAIEKPNPERFLQPTFLFPETSEPMCWERFEEMALNGIEED